MALNRKNKMTFLILLVFGLALLMAGCGGNQPSEPTGSDSSAGNDQIQVEDLLSKGENISGLSFDSVISQEGSEIMVTKVWQKGSNMRIEMDMPADEGKMVSLVRGDEQVMYSYNEAQGMAMKMPLAQSEVNTETPEDYIAGLTAENMKYVKTEIIDGRQCQVYDVSTADAESRMWIWKDYGLPLKIETIVEGEAMVFEYRNIKVGDIADSQFELPAGIEVMDLENMQIP
ncbi:MAG: DUF4412 domain-containing protein [Syntrophomonadaceae bacterium]|nr:DUF4412 domain-containing protein [Syntrophomonadaceae bacterium]